MVLVIGVDRLHHRDRGPGRGSCGVGSAVPSYMIPAAAAIDALPLTVTEPPHPRPAGSAISDTDRYRAPTTHSEEILTGIYAHMLDLDRVSIDDSFFDLGGDSLSAMRLIAAINTALDTGLSVRTVFEVPTIAQLVLHIPGDEGPLEPLAAIQRPAIVPLSFAQTRLWFIDQFQGPITDLQLSCGVAIAAGSLMPTR